MRARPAGGSTVQVRQIFSYWYQGALRRTDWVCLDSWVRHGFEVTLYSHHPHLSVPNGVTLANAEPILSVHPLQQLVPLRFPERATWQPIVNYSDLFRMAGLAQGCGLWLDTDVFVLRPFEVVPDRPFMAWEGFRRIGSPVLYLPPESPMTATYLSVLDDVEQIPSWVEWRKAVWRPLRWRLQGLKYRPGDLGITVFGNYAFTRLGRKYYGRRDVLPKHRFYAWIGDQTRRFYQDPRGEAALEAVGAWGIHIHRKDLDRAEPVQGSLFDKALRRLRPPL